MQASYDKDDHEQHENARDNDPDQPDDLQHSYGIVIRWRAIADLAGLRS